jgi:hypothetical protein
MSIKQAGTLSEYCIQACSWRDQGRVNRAAFARLISDENDKPKRQDTI